MAKSEDDKVEQVIALAKNGLIDPRTAAKMLGLGYAQELGASQLENDLARARRDGQEMALLVDHHLSVIKSRFAVRDPSGKIVGMDDQAFSDYWSTTVAANQKAMSKVLKGEFPEELFVTNHFYVRCANVDFVHDGATIHVPTRAGLAMVGTRMYLIGGPRAGYAVAKRRGHVFMLEKRAAEQGAQGPWYLLDDVGEGECLT